MSTPGTSDLVAALAKLNALRWRKYHYQAGDTPTGGQPVETDVEVVGPVLSDMLADPDLAPMVVHDPETGEPYSYDLSSYVGYLAQAVAELTTQVADLKRQLEQKPSGSLFPWEPGWFLGRR